MTIIEDYFKEKYENKYKILKVNYTFLAKIVKI